MREALRIPGDSKQGMTVALGTPGDSKRGIRGALESLGIPNGNEMGPGIPRGPKTEMRETLGIPRDSKK